MNCTDCKVVKDGGTRWAGNSMLSKYLVDSETSVGVSVAALEYTMDDFASTIAA